MGCSSSAPKTISANSSKGDKSIQSEEDAEEIYSKHVEAIDTESKNQTETKMLPRSDTTEPIQQLARYNKSTTSLETEKDLNTTGQVLESGHIDTSEITKKSKDEEKDDAISKLKLEEVVGKFIEKTQDTNHEKDAGDHTEEAAELKYKDNETDAKLESEQNDDEHKNNSEEPEEASPSQSQSSRATRWEALADIAAELPPSLAVDPLTGQIYSLSK